MDDQYFCLRLWDYGVPSFVSKGKAYYGTLDDIRTFMAALESDEKTREDFRETLAAFREFEAGNHAVTHNVAYRDILLLETVDCLGSVMIDLGEYEWDHTNIWGCIYSMKCDHVRLCHLWLSGPEGSCRAFQAQFENLQYQGSDGSWLPLTGGFWGHPQMLHLEEDVLCNRLAVHEKTFEDRRSARKDLVRFDADADLDFTEFCNEIFGEG